MCPFLFQNHSLKSETKICLNKPFNLDKIEKYNSL